MPMKNEQHRKTGHKKLDALERQQERRSNEPTIVAPASVVGEERLYATIGAHALTCVQRKWSRWVGEHSPDFVRAMNGFPQPAPFASVSGAQPASHEPGSLSTATPLGSTSLALVPDSILTNVCDGRSTSSLKDPTQGQPGLVPGSPGGTGETCSGTAVAGHQGEGYGCMSRKDSASKRLEPHQSVLNDPIEVHTQKQQQKQQLHQQRSTIRAKNYRIYSRTASRGKFFFGINSQHDSGGKIY